MLEAIIDGARQPLTPDDYIITQVSSGQDTLQFSLSRQDPAVMVLEERTRIYETATGQTFWLSGIDAGQSTVTFEGKKDLSDWEKTVYTGYTNGSASATAQDTIAGVLPEGWTLKLAEADTLKAYIALQGPTALEVVEHCMEVYGCGAVFDNKQKTLTIHFPGKKALGPAFFVDTANLRAAPEYKGKATGIVTRLYAQGADNVDFAAINDGKSYVECFDYTDEVIAGYWRDERYTVPEHLLEAAREKVRALSQPERSWSLEICDLNAIDPETWPGLELELFSVVRLIDRTRGSTMQAQITEIRSRPHHPEQNEVSISAVAGTLGPTTGSILRRLRKGTLYENLEITVDRVKTAADQALEDAAQAQQEAWQAGTAADNAQTAADNAQTAADNAQTAADDARTAAAEAKSAVVQLADSITLSVENGYPGSKAQIRLGVNGETQTGEIDLTGAVTFSDLSTPGKTTIDGGNITTGLISASCIDTNELFANAINTTKLELDSQETTFPELTLKGTNNTFSISSSATSMGNPTSFVSSTGELNLSSNSAITLEPGSGESASGYSGVTVVGNLAAESWGYKQTITVGGDLDTYYPVHIVTACSANDMPHFLGIGKKLGSTSPAWSGNHSSGTSSLTIGWLYRAYGWDGNGYWYKTLYKKEPYAALVAHVVFMSYSAKGVVVWLRGGGAAYDINSSAPVTSAKVYTASTNIGTSSYPYTVAPMTAVSNGGWASSYETDYVVAQGTSGIWSYRKWNSGMAECWGRESKSFSLTNEWYGLYYDNYTVTFPFTFSRVTFASMQPFFAGGLYGSDIYTVANASAQFHIWGTYSTSFSGYAQTYVMGRWK